MAAKFRPATALALGSVLCAGWVTAAPTSGIAAAQDADPAAEAAFHQAEPADWANPDARSTDPDLGISLQVRDISPRFVTKPAGERAGQGEGADREATQTYSLRIRNTSPTAIRGLTLSLKTAPPAGSPAQVRTALLSNSGEYPQSSPVQPLSRAGGGAVSLAPGESADVDVRLLRAPSSQDANPAPADNGSGEQTAPAGALAPMSFELPGAAEPGTYPILFALGGSFAPLDRGGDQGDGAGDGADAGESQDPEGNGADAGGPVELLAVTRATAVISPAAGKGAERGGGNGEEAGGRDRAGSNGAGSNGAGSGDAGQDDSRPSGTPLTFLWPIGGDTHATPGAVGDAPEPAELYLSDDALAVQLGEGGRLRGLLDSYRAAVDGPEGAAIRKSSCLAIDPDLLRTVERMAGGYRVGETVPKPVEESKRLRDSWGDIFNRKDRSEPGAGNNQAAQWLADLKETAQGGCTVALPYGGADINPTAQATGPTNPADEAAGEAGAAGSDADPGATDTGSADAAGETGTNAGANGTSTDGANPAANTSAPTSAAWLSTQALGRGAATIKDVLGTTPAANIAVPSSGYLTPQALPYLAAAKVDPDSPNADLAHRFEVTLKGQAILPSLDPASPVTALVSDNSVLTQRPAQPAASSNDGAGNGSGDPQKTGSDQQWNERLLKLNEEGSLRALRYSGDLGTALAATGTNPQITGYSNPQSRFDVTVDSEASAMSNALAVLQQELAEPTPILAVPPGEWGVSATDATALLEYIEHAFATGQATPAFLGDALRPRGIDTAGMALGEVTQPFTDPGAPTEALAPQLATLADRIRSLTLTMHNSSQIALRREEFTRPMMADLARATTAYGTRNPATQAQASERAAARVKGAAATADVLRNSVTLLPPGNVFTRTSESAPLIVVAQNGLPLPVPAKIRYRDTREEQAGQPAEILESDSQTIPARGSLTVPIDLGSTDRRSDLDLWLASPNDKRISDSVQVSVHSSPNVPLDKLIIVLALVGAAGLGGKVLLDRNRRRKRASRPPREGR